MNKNQDELNIEMSNIEKKSPEILKNLNSKD